ncbi:MAG: hypothetical protein LBB23_01615 [Rickettsiales bacterium]|jgi:cell division protein FtsX|nr:hypothetical protein [Rickettsiales bacterium]
MSNNPTLFRPSPDQSAYLAAMSAFMTFIIVLCLGVSLALDNAVDKWSKSWELKATIQVLQHGDLEGVKRILKDEAARVKSVRQLGDTELGNMLRPWMRGDYNLTGYLPAQIDLTFHEQHDLRIVGEKTTGLKSVKFIAHSDAIGNMVVFGTAIRVLAGVIILFVMLASSLGLIYAIRSMIRIHKRDIEILNVVGAYDSFIIGSISAAMLKLSAIGGVLGLAAGGLAAYGVVEIANAQKTGIISQMAINSTDMLIMGLIPIALSAAAFMLARKTTARTLLEGGFE